MHTYSFLLCIDALFSMPCCLPLTIAHSNVKAPKCFQCLIGMIQYMDHLLIYLLLTWMDISHRLLCINLVKIWSFELFIFEVLGLGWFYANQGSAQIFLIGWPIAPPWFLGSGHSVDSVLAMCAHPLGAHMHLLPKSIYFNIPALQRIMLICGFHCHSRYSIWISTFVLLHTVYFKAIACGSQGVPVATNW